MRAAWSIVLVIGCGTSSSSVDAGSLGDAGVPTDAASSSDTANATDANNNADVGAPSPSDVPFTATGPWRTKLPPTTPIASNSSAVVANIVSDIANNYKTFGINTDTYSSPIFTVAANAPTSDWSFDDCDGQGSLDPKFGACLKGVPTLTTMFPSMGTDSEITIYSPSLDEEWEFWVAKSNAGKWSACWGGCITNVSQNPGIFTPNIGATACGLPLLGFLVRVDELTSALITHAVNIAVVRTQAGVFSWPANRTDGNTADPDVLMEGQRMRLDPTFDVSTLPISAERTIAKAMQDYGIILTDTSGAVDLQAEDPRSYNVEHGTTGDPYASTFEGRASYAVLQEIPVGKFQVLPKDYGQSFMK